MTDIQQQVQETIDTLVESGVERGLQVAVYRNGELVVDAVAGLADAETKRPVTSDTPFYSTSTGKGITTTVAHVLVERGVLKYDTPVAELWPEFAANGKESATVRHVLTHATGVPGLPADTTPEDLANWDKMVAVIADATPWWEPGTKFGYHAQTYGYLVGELVRRATGKTISEALREYVAVPLGLERELFFGVPESELARTATLEEVQNPDAGGGEEFTPEMLAEIPFFKVVHGYTAAPMAALPGAEFGNRNDILTSDIPAGGTFSARALAKVYAALLGEVGGVRLVSPERLRTMTAEAVSGDDEILGFPTARGLGYDIGLPSPTAAPAPTVFGTAGSEGSAAFADTASKVTFALTKNRVTQGDYSAVDRVHETVVKALGL
ncbi:serine hydrolase domain-containing protein [Streptomyces sp. NPDC053048]|uniref:serine hydrolase domain-containing protein n=1 Tax=Streptomyces sp. NPDC053048 TaxID=3365694 RepID=UPI0037D35CD1